MPEIRSRISSSSSTIRISDAINDPFLVIFFSAFHTLLHKRKTEHDDRPLPALTVVQGNLAAMVFHDLAHDGEAQPGALGPRGDVWLGQAVAVLRRQPDAIVGDAI